MIELTFKERSQIVKKFFDEYIRASMSLSMLEDKDFYPVMSYQNIRETSPSFDKKEHMLIDHMEKKEQLRKRIYSTDRILLALKEEHREMLEKEYLFYEKDWWQCYYSKSTYYRIKKKAIDELLFYLIGE